MLLVFAMAAAVVVTLYLEAPRLAQQALRSKEQLLIDRGEQYQRAIQVFARTLKKYPQSIDELEKFQDKRYLRRRYKDPFTGEEEWRLIHYNNGVFPDSKVYGPKKEGEGKESKQTFIGELPFINNPGDQNDPNAQNPATQRRASDRPAIASGQSGAEAPQADPNAPPADPNQPVGQAGAVPGLPTGVPAAPGQPGAVPVIPNAPGIPGMPSFRPANPIQPQQQGQQQGNNPTPNSVGGFIGGSIPAPGGVSNSQTGGTSSFIGGGSSATTPNTPGPRSGGATGAFSGMSGAPGGLPSGGPGQVPTAAADLIRQILTTPRAGGMPGAQGVAQGGLGAGIAGVASKREATGIKIYNERTRYDEWEFVYDQTKEAKSQMQAAGVNSQGTNQPGGPLQSNQQGSQQGSQPAGQRGGTGSTIGSGSQTTTPSNPSMGPGTVGGFIGGSVPAPPSAPAQPSPPVQPKK